MSAFSNCSGHLKQRLVNDNRRCIFEYQLRRSFGNNSENQNESTYIDSACRRSFYAFNKRSKPVGTLRNILFVGRIADRLKNGLRICRTLVTDSDYSGVYKHGNKLSG